jgi:hypothetical protein
MESCKPMASRPGPRCSRISVWLQRADDKGAQGARSPKWALEYLRLRCTAAQRQNGCVGQSQQWTRLPTAFFPVMGPQTTPTSAGPCFLQDSMHGDSYPCCRQSIRLCLPAYSSKSSHGHQDCRRASSSSFAMVVQLSPLQIANWMASSLESVCPYWRDVCRVGLGLDRPWTSDSLLQPKSAVRKPSLVSCGTKLLAVQGPIQQILPSKSRISANRVAPKGGQLGIGHEMHHSRSSEASPSWTTRRGFHGSLGFDRGVPATTCIKLRETSRLTWWRGAGEMVRQRW